MTGENLETTVLHEHRKVVTFRHLLALVNFIAIFVGTLITRHYVLIRGSEKGILVLINLIWIVNIAQIALCLADYILKVILGRYYKALVIASYSVGGLWLVLIIAELIVGSSALGSLRIDLAVIFALQLITAGIAYIVWPSMDYFTIQQLTRPTVRDDSYKKAKKIKAGIARYILVCIVMVALQGCMLLAYKLPPKVYDLFADSRAIQYKLTEDGEAYEVIGVYQGTSSYVNIPAYYNNKPVIRIVKGALSDASLIEKYKVDTIELGTATVDENGNTVVESNLSVIEAGAIDNNSITSLFLPDSIIKIETGAIKSSSLKTVVYSSRSDFAYSYFNCSSLSTITFEGENAGKIVSLEGLGDNVTIEVDKDIYNTYREKNKEYMQALRPLIADDEFVIDFYTGSDYYIKSIIGKVGQSVQIGYADLFNGDLTGTAPSVDTLAYIRNNHETGTFGTKADSAFRGWYFDQAFTEECVFTETGKLSFNGDTSIYAKWIDEYTGNLDWSTHQPDGQPSVLYWTDEDLVTFPVITDRIGYADGIEWFVDNSHVTSSQNISKSVTVKGSWIFDKPVIDIESSVLKNDDSSFVVSTDKNFVSYTYDEAQTLNLEGVMRHPFDGKSGFSYSTEWRRADTTAFTKYDKSIKLSKVPESGEYILKVTAKSPFGEESVIETSVNVSIAKKNLDIGDSKLSNTVFEYAPDNQHVVITGSPVDERLNITYYYFNEAGEQVSRNDGVRNVGTYTVKAVFEKNNAEEAANYNTRELIAELVINPRELVFIEWNAISYVYNSTELSVEMVVDGRYANDTVNIIYEGNKATNAGTYVAKAVGVDNPNYSIKNIDRLNNCIQEWTIYPKEVTVKEWKLDGATTNSFAIVYNGEEHNITAVPEGIFAADEGNVEFVFDQMANTIAATNANTYTARIIGVSNPNYTFDTESAFAVRQWQISKRSVSISYASTSIFTYSGKTQGVNATLSNIVEKDLKLFKREKLRFEGKTGAVNVTEISTSGSNLVINFNAKDVGSYIAAISGIDPASDISLNYTISTSTKNFSITPKSISFVNNGSYTYNGKSQELEIIIKGFVAEDIGNVALDQFTFTTVQSGKAVGSDYVLVINGKDAGVYNFEITSFNNPNYRMESYSNSVRIAPKKLALEWNIKDLGSSESTKLTANKTVAYNFAGFKAYADIVGLVEGENAVLTYVNDEKKNAGQYQTTASLDPSYSNYELTTESIAWSITPYVLDFTWSFNGVVKNVSNGNVPTFTYNASAVTVTPGYTPLGTDIVNISYSGTANDTVKTNANVSNYKVAVASLDNPNYAIGANSSFEWKIDPKVVNVTWVLNSGATYDGTYKGKVFSINGVLDNGRFVGGTVNGAQTYFEIASLDSSTQYSFADKKLAINAGTYTHNVTAIYTSDGLSGYTVDTNYTVDCTSKSFKIEKAPLTLAGWTYSNNGSSAAFNESSRLVYNTKPFEIRNAIVESPFERESIADDVYLVYSGHTATNYNENGYKATVSLGGAHASNYYINDEVSVDWAIQQKPITAVWESNSFIYVSRNSFYNQTADPVFGATADDDLKVYDVDQGMTHFFSYEGNQQAKAGQYTAKIVSIINSNYKLVENETYGWEIAKKVIDITWSASSFTYNGAVQTPVGSYTGNDTVYVSEYDMEASKNAGAYTIKALALDNPNYELSTASKVEHNYTINPKVINFTWGYNGNTSGASNYEYDGSSRAVNAYHDAFAGDVVNLTYSEPVGITDRTIHDAGAYTFTVTGIDNDNYVLNGGSNGTSITLTVSPRAINLTWGFDGNKTGAAGYEYTGITKTISAYVSNLCDGDNVVLSYNTDDFDLLNAGTYTYQVTGCDNDNYVLSTGTSKSITVSRKVLSFEWIFGADTTKKASHFTYDGEIYTVNAYAKNLCGNDGITLVYDKANRDICNAGSYPFTITGITGEDAANYVLPSSSYCQHTVNVSKQTLTIKWNGETSVTYDGSKHSLIATLTGTNKGEPINIAPIYQLGENGYTNANTYTIKVTGIEDSTNYQLPTADTSRTLVIKKQPVKVTWAGATTVTYDGNPHALTATVKGANDSNPIEFNYNHANTNSFTAAGNYDITITLNNPNYTAEGQTTGKRLVINPQLVEIEWTYDKNIVYDGQYHYMTATVKGASDGKTVSSFTYSGSNGFINAGTHSVRVSSTGNGNYKLPTDGSDSMEITIAPQPVTVTWSNIGNIMYDGYSHSPIATIKAKNTGETVSAFNYTGTSAITNVGTITRTITLTNSNYTLDGMTGSNKGTVTIIPQPVRINWTGIGTMIYDGEQHRPTATVRGINSGADVSFRYSSDAYITNAGESTTRTITLTNSNYTLENCEGETTGTLAIEKQRVRITWSGAEVVTYDGISHSIVATVKGYNDGRVVSSTYKTVNYGTNVGAYDIEVLLSNTNYTLEDCEGVTEKTLTINPQSVVISWNGATSVTYDGAYHKLIATVKGSIDNSNVSFVYETENSGKNAGDYLISIALDDDNYTLENCEGVTEKTLTINPQSVVIEWTGEGEFEYDGEEHTLTATVKGADDGANVYFNYTDDSVTEFTEEGTYTATVEELLDSNYTLEGATITATATITAAQAE